ADTLEQQFRPNGQDDDHTRRIKNDVETRINNDDNQTIINPTSPTEVRKIIKNLKVKKAPGMDGISNRMIRQLPDKAVMHIVAILRLRHFPEKWKIADVIMLLKAGKSKTSPQSYRPISLLPCIGKLAEKVILWRLKDCEHQLNVIPDEQFGFRENHSTTEQVLRVAERITQSFNWNRHTGAVFLDVAKAFDKVWHEGLLHKFIAARFPISLVKLVKSFLEERKFRVKIGNARSSARTIQAGVPQGSLLSPFLYAIFTADAPRPVD